MKKVTQEDIATVLGLLGKARLYVSTADLMVSDLAEKANDLIATLERKVAEIEAESNAESETQPAEGGGTEGDLPSRDSMITYIKETLSNELGFEGVWAFPNLVEQFSDEEIAAYYAQAQRAKQDLD